MEQEIKEQIIPAEITSRNINKKILWIPWIGLCVLFIIIIYAAGWSVIKQASDSFGGGIFVLFMLLPVIVLACLGFLTFAAVSNKIQSNQKIGETPKNNHKAALAIIGILVVFLFSFCIWFILKK